MSKRSLTLIDSTEHRLLESVATTVSTPIIAAMAWFAHATLLLKRFPNAVEFTGGIITAGFVAWAFASVFAFSGMHSEVASPIAAVLGASGEAGFKALVKFAKKTGGL